MEEAQHRVDHCVLPASPLAPRREPEQQGIPGFGYLFQAKCCRQQLC